MELSQLESDLIPATERATRKSFVPQASISTPRLQPSYYASDFARERATANKSNQEQQRQQRLAISRPVPALETEGTSSFSRYLAAKEESKGGAETKQYGTLMEERQTKSPSGTSAVTAAMKALQDRIALLELQNRDLNVQMRQKEKTFEEERERLNNRVHDALTLNSEVSDKCKALDEEKERIEAGLKGEISTLMKEDEAIKYRLTQLAEENEGLKREIDRLSGEKGRHLEQNAADLERWRRERAELVSRNEKYKERLAGCERKKQDARAEAEELKQRLTSLVDVVERLKKLYAEEISGVKSVADECRQGVQQMRLQYDTDLAITKAVYIPHFLPR